MRPAVNSESDSTASASTDAAAPTANPAQDSPSASARPVSWRMDRFFDLAVEMLCVAGMGGRFKRVNPAFERTLGYSQAELLTRPFLDFVHPDDRASTQAESDKLARGEPTVHFANRYLCKDGSYRWLAWMATPALSEGLIYATARDVTDERLRADRLRFQASILDQLRELIAATDLAGTVTYCNETAAHLVGRSCEHLVGQSIAALVRPHVAEVPLEQVWSQIQQMGHWRGELTWRLPHGGQRRLDCKAWLMRSADGEPIGYCGVVSDVTEARLAEDARRLAEQRYALATSAAGGGVWDWDLVTNSLYLDPAVKATLGFGADETVDDMELWSNYVHPADRAAIDAAIAAHLDGRTPEFAIEHRALHKDGSVRWILARGRAVRDASERAIRLVGTDTDITERKLAEEALTARLRYEEHIAAASRCLLADADSDRMMNEAMRRLLLAADVARVYVFRNFVDEDGELCVQQTHEVCAPGVTSALADPELQHFPYRGNMEAWHDRLARGEPIAATLPQFPGPMRDMLTSQDIQSLLLIPIMIGGTWYGFIGFDELASERIWGPEDVRLLQTGAEIIGAYIAARESARALRASEMRFRRVFEYSPIGIQLFDGEGALVAINDTARRLYEISRPDVVGCYNLFQDTRFEGAWIDALRRGELVRGELSLAAEGDEAVDSDRGRPVFAEVVMLSLGTDQDRPSYLVMTLDITDRKQADVMVARHRDELAHAARLSLLGEIATGLAHELNQPLAASHNYIQSCLRRIEAGTDAPAKVADSLAKAAVQTERAGQIIRRIRDFVCHKQTAARAVPVNRLVREALSLLDSELVSKGVRVEAKLARDLPDAWVDPIQIEQVIVNLVRNGIDAMDHLRRQEAKLTVATGRLTDDWIEVGITDRGRGLSDEVRDRLFTPFFTTKTNGLGMGLSISRRIIEAHGGRCWAENDPDGGACFRFTVPVARDDHGEWR